MQDTKQSDGQTASRFAQPNVDAATGIHYGVIAQHSIMPEAFDEVWQDARDLTHEAAIAECKAELAACETDEEIAEFLQEHFFERQIECIGTIPLDADADARWAMVEDCFNDSYENYGDRSWLYEQDGYKLADCLSTDVFVLASPYYTHAPKCSPCVPNAGNLDSIVPEQNYSMRTYCLSHDWFDGGKAPYLVYSVETGELVLPDVQ